MGRFLPLFGSSGDGSFDRWRSCEAEHLPSPGRFLLDHDVLTGDEHAAFHRLTRNVFEARAVYDVTFGYNLARLNLDSRHPDAGFRYARETPADSREPGAANVLRAEFTPTTAFCPQAEMLTMGAFRAWNGLSDRHEYDLVRVRVAPMHQDSDALNGMLQQFETELSGAEPLPVPEPDDLPDGGSAGGPVPSSLGESTHGLPEESGPDETPSPF